MDLKSKIRDVPNFPKEGIVFKDITTLLQDPKAFRQSIEQLKEHYKDQQIDVIVGPESRGFIFGIVLAYELGVSFVPIRKPGKLPAETLSQEYVLEYGTDKIEIHKDSIEKGKKVLVVDDLLATGGTSEAASKLIKKLEGDIVGFAFLIELCFLKGREKLKGYNVYSLIDYNEE
ncbi:MAG: adenine phosphoribosyltransferase [Nanoarchaeota archaeon]|nr:adenine phosphoribosyltransferase [Nanoarchaeota archaeon]